jgi:very-short-patch-repair endonuclease
MPRIIEIPDLDNLVKRYIAGESENKLSREAGVNRMTFRLRLLKAGVTPRNQSQSEALKWANMTPAQRKRQVAAAHRAAIGRKISVAEKIARSKTVEIRQSHVSPIEIELAKRLRNMGLDIATQKSVYFYNVDIAVNSPPIAVEIYGGGFHNSGDHATRHHKRTKKLLNLGWSVLIVWIDARRYPLSVGCDNYVIEFIDELRRNPTPRGKYRVILGNGQPAPAISSYFNAPADIKRLGGGG